MSTKALALTTGAGGSAAAAATVAYTQTNEEIYLEELDFEETKAKEEPEEDIPSTLTVTKDGDFYSIDADKWDASGDGGPCVKHYLKKINLRNGPTVGHSSIFSSEKGNANGCLYVHWNKKKKTNGGNWKGVFKLEFLLRQGSEALLVHGFMKSSDSKGLLDVKLRGFLTKKNNKGWKVNLTTEKIEKATKSYVFQDSDENEFCVKGNKKEVDNTKRVFEFSPWIQKACPLGDSNGECSGLQYTGDNNGGTKETKHKLRKWSKDNSGQKTVSSWSVNFNTWWNYFLGSSFSINNAHKWKGTWTEQTLSQ